jgi:hypothetical protein
MLFRKENICFFILILLPNEIFCAEVTTNMAKTKWVQTHKKRITERQVQDETIYGDNGLAVMEDLFDGSGVIERRGIKLFNYKTNRQLNSVGMVTVSEKLVDGQNQIMIKFSDSATKSVSAFRMKNHFLFIPPIRCVSCKDCGHKKPLVVCENGNVHIYMKNQKQEIVKYTLTPR